MAKIILLKLLFIVFAISVSTILSIPLLGIFFLYYGCYIRRCSSISFDELLNKTKYFYHYTSAEGLDSIYSSDRLQIKGYFRFSNVLNYANLIIKLWRKPVIFFYAGRPTDNQFFATFPNGWKYGIRIDIEKAEETIRQLPIYFRKHDNAVIIATDNLIFDNNMACLRRRRKGKLKFILLFKCIFQKKI